MNLSVIIPCYNESKVIATTLSQVENFLKEKGYTYEIIVVDDGSADDSQALVSKFGVRLIKNETNRGKGFSVKKGVLASGGDWVLFLDADGSTPIRELEKLLPFTNDYDIVIGSRDLPNSQVEKHQWWGKEILGKLGNHLIQLVLGLEIKDTQCGFKLFKREVKEIFGKQTLDGWGFDFELLFIARQKGFKIKEVGVRWVNDESSTVTIGGYVRTLGEVFKVRVNGWLGKYE